MVKGGGNDKTDLMPFEVDELKKLSPNDIEKIRAVIAQGNEMFAKKLTVEDIKQILKQINKEVQSLFLFLDVGHRKLVKAIIDQ